MNEEIEEISRRRSLTDEITELRERLHNFYNGDASKPVHDWKLAFLQEESENILTDASANLRSVAFASLTAEIIRELLEQINCSTFMTAEQPAQPAKFHLVKVADVFDEMKQMLERWDAEKRVGSVSYNEEFDAICFHFDATTPRERYHFYLGQMPTGEAQMQWLNHLRKKRWFTGEVFDDFMQVMEILGLIKRGLG